MRLRNWHIDGLFLEFPCAFHRKLENQENKGHRDGLCMVLFLWFSETTTKTKKTRGVCMDLVWFSLWVSEKTKETGKTKCILMDPLQGWTLWCTLGSVNMR